MGEPLPITVSGTNPSGSFVVSVEDDVITAMGGGCLDGQEVTVKLVGYSYDLGIEELDRQAGRALARRSIPDFAKAAEADEGQFETTLTVTPGADGTWSVTAPAPAGSLELTATADCGDPTGTGFRYVRRFVYESNSADLYVEPVEPHLVARRRLGAAGGERHVRGRDPRGAGRARTARSSASPSRSS